MVDAAELAAFLGDRVAKWQVPERWSFIDEVPKTCVGQVRQEGAARPPREGRPRCRTAGLKSGTRAAPKPSGVEAAPAATVVLLRDGDGGLEVLLGKRSSKLKFHGGAWVFPGGRIDPEDYGDDPDDLDAAARRAAAREAKEEAGVDVDPDALVHFSNWTTPDISPKRFATWFFVGPVAGGTEIADGAETDEMQWFGARRSARRARGGRDRARTAAVRHVARPAASTRRSTRRWPRIAAATPSTSRRASTSSKAVAQSACTATTSRTTTSRCSTRKAPGTVCTSTRPAGTTLRVDSIAAGRYLLGWGVEPEVRLDGREALRELLLGVLVRDRRRR